MEHCRVRVDCVVPCKWRLANKVARSLPNRLGKSSDLFRGSQLQDCIRANDSARIACSLLQAVVGVGGLSDKPASTFFDVFDTHARCNGGFGLIGVTNIGDAVFTPVGWGVTTMLSLGMSSFQNHMS